MSHNAERLRATIRELEDELKTIGPLDAETRSLLEEALLDIDAKIQEPSPAIAEQELLSHRLSGAAERFETTHPTLFGVLTRLADALAQMGI